MKKKYPPRKTADLVAQIFSEFPHLSQKAYQHITIGWDHDVIILDNQIVFRFPNDEDYASSLQTEIEMLKLLKPKLTINIPSYSFIAKNKKFAGYPIIPGEFLSKELLDSLTKSTRYEIVNQLADTLTTLHTIIQNKNDFDAVPQSYMYSDQNEVKLQADQYLKPILSSEDWDGVTQILKNVDGLLEQSLPVVLIHGDVYSQHLLWDESSNMLGLIDFSDMARADPAIDFAELYEYGEHFVQEVYESYAGPKDNTFLERAWIYQCWIGVFMMTDHFIYHKTSFVVARETFDRIKAYIK